MDSRSESSINWPWGSTGGRCHGRSLCDKSKVILANLLWNVHKDDMEPVLQTWALSTGNRYHVSATGDRQHESATGDDSGHSQKWWAAVRMVADMTGINSRTVAALATEFKKGGWVGAATTWRGSGDCGRV